jgi:hypothetical protein
MKTHRSMFVSMLMAFGVSARAQDDAKPAPAETPAAPAQTDMQKWFTALDAQWQAVFRREVTAPMEAEQTKLWQQFLSALETGVTKATSTGNLDLALAWRNELERFSGAKDVPAEDELGVLPAIKQLRAGWRVQNAKIQKDRADRARAVRARYDQVLAQAQTQLTQRQRLDDALLVKAKREEIAAAWLTSAQTTASPARPDSPQKPAAVAPKVPFGTNSATGFASVDASDVILAPLAKDEKLWSDRDVRLLKIPAKFKDFQFTQAKAHGLTLRFKVLSDGLVYMACSERWGSTAAPDMAKDFATAETLKEAGWTHVPGVEITTTSGDMSWTIFSRPCKAGEEFTYRTEKYAPPILLVK